MPYSKYTNEVCPYCDTTVKIFKNKVAVCPNCGNNITPCSTCPHIIGTINCDWSENNGCRRFPKKNAPPIKVKFEDLLEDLLLNERLSRTDKVLAVFLINKIAQGGGYYECRYIEFESYLGLSSSVTAGSLSRLKKLGIVEWIKHSGNKNNYIIGKRVEKYTGSNTSYN